jgi:rhamnulokinase
VTRCILDSLALGYRQVVEDLTAVTGRTIPALHIVGGGSRNHLLNQLAADVTGLPVLAGPAEATALGNILVQLVALGELGGLEEARALVRAGARDEISRVEPSGDDRVAQLHSRYRELVQADLTATAVPG